MQTLGWKSLVLVLHLTLPRHDRQVIAPALSLQ